MGTNLDIECSGDVLAADLQIIFNWRCTSCNQTSPWGMINIKMRLMNVFMSLPDQHPGSDPSWIRLYLDQILPGSDSTWISVYLEYLKIQQWMPYWDHNQRGQHPLNPKEGECWRAPLHLHSSVYRRENVESTILHYIMLFITNTHTISF